MSKIKKLAPSVADKIEYAERICDEIEARGYEVIRFRTRSRVKANTTVGVYGFEGFSVEPGTRARKLMECRTLLFPAVDGYIYGYVPKTKHNMTKFAELLDCKRFTVDDPDVIDEVKELAEELGRNTTYVPKVEVKVKSEEEKKLEELAELRRLVELKEYDDEIAALKRRLAGEPSEDPVTEKVKSTPKRNLSDVKIDR